MSEEKENRLFQIAEIKTVQKHHNNEVIPWQLTKHYWQAALPH